MQSRSMKTDQAAEALQTIRTLMERSALYRRALAPIMTFAGGLGILAALIGWFLRVTALKTFIAYWFAVAFIGLFGSLLLVRRQAIKTAEPFWSPPTRRVAHAMLPALTVGFLLGIWIFIISADPFGSDPAYENEYAGILGGVAAIWVILYGCGLHAGGFFTARGLRHLGWVLIAVGNLILGWWFLLSHRSVPQWQWWHGHAFMGAAFGCIQLAYGIYLFITGEEQNEL